MKLVVFSSVLLSLFIIGCGGTSPRLTTAGQIISNSWEGEDDLNEKDTWKTLRPPVIITKTDSGDVVALFVGEFATKPTSHPVDIAIGTETDKTLVVYGIPIELRIKVNDIIASPTSSVIMASFVITGAYETRSFLASLRNLPPGTHTITAEWRSISTGGRVRNRTLTVWETVKTSAP